MSTPPTAAVGPSLPSATRSGEVTTLPKARREFLRHRSPWVIVAIASATLIARLAIGAFDWRDAAAAAALLAIYPFGEWAIHVYLLHARPLRIRGRRWELPSTRAHRVHHEQPNRLDMVLLEPLEAVLLLLLAVPAAVGLLAVVPALASAALPAGALLSAVLTGQLAVLAYEWCHYLIHTAHQPRSRLFRSVWRSHRLHHFKNEHYWHGVTTNLADRVLRTFPEQREVPRSRTARTLRAEDA